MSDASCMMIWGWFSSEALDLGFLWVGRAGFRLAFHPLGLGSPTSRGKIPTR